MTEVRDTTQQGGFSTQTMKTLVMDAYFVKMLVYNCSVHFLLKGSFSFLLSPKC